MTEAIIQIQDLEKRFRSKNTEVYALQGINLTIRKGDIFGIIGKSGAGKSIHFGYKNRRSFLNVYIIERLVLSHIFYFNRYNSCLSPCIFVVFITCVIYNLHVVGKKSLIDIPHWPEHYEVLSYHFWPAYRQNRLSVFVPEDRCIPLGEI